MLKSLIDVKRKSKKGSYFIRVLLLFTTIIIIFGAGIFAGNKVHIMGTISRHFSNVFPSKENAKKEDIYQAFVFEVYDLILNEYWNNINEEQLGNLAKLAIEKITNEPQSVSPANREALKKQLAQIMQDMSDEEKKQFATHLSDLVLANLEPFGRSRLYTFKQQEDLGNTVMNIQPDTNRYADLGLEKGSSQGEIKKAYETKAEELKSQEQTPEVTKQLAQVERAFEALGDEDSRKIYDESGIEPTISYRLINPRIFYIHIKKFSPTTLQELQKATSKVDGGKDLNTLIIDLRGNIGGAIDGLPNFLGPFIGKGQYAYQFYRRGEKEDFITKTGWMDSLVHYKKVVVLIDRQTQSSAEVFASVLKKYNVGVLVGETTKGWGTVEKIFQLQNQIDQEEKYSAFLVHHLTLREDGQPIEGKGVEPAISINLDGWEEKLYSYFSYQELIDTVKKLIGV